MKKIYFKGYYGFENIGDDIFCVTADWICNHKWKGKKAVFIGSNLPKLSANSIKVNAKSSFLRRIYEVLVCFKVNYIIYFGGSVLSKISGIKDIKFYLNKFSKFNSKLGTIGTSIGPFENDKDYNSIKNLLGKFKFISVRDYSSLALIEEMQYKSTSSFSFDPAILITDVFPSLNYMSERNINKKTKIAVSLCHYERYKGMDISTEIKREKAVMNFIIDIINKTNDIEEVVFFVFNGNEINGDVEITRQFENEIKRIIQTRVVEYTSNTENFCSELKECDFLIGLRLHSGILAYTLNIPFLLVEYHPKCTEFLNTINNNSRFDINNNQKNIETYEYIMKKGSLVDLKEPEYFKELFYDEINKIGEVL